MSFPRYPHTKDSGIEWLGQIPEHWDVAPLKLFCSCNDEVLSEKTNDDTPIIYIDISSVSRYEGVKNKEILTFASAPSRARRRVQEGDVIVSTVRTYLRAIARIESPEENLIVSTGFAVLRPFRSVSSSFLGYFSFSDYFVEQIVVRSTGVSYPSITSSLLMGIHSILPPLGEQKQIAAFLDRETAKIDALVAEQQNLLNLLKEKRQAVISHAVTKGLDPNAPLKPSGIEWLGDVPAHWDVCLLKRNLTSSDYGISDPLNLEGEIAILRMGNIQDSKVKLDDLKYVNSVDDKLILKKGDLLYNRTNSIDLVGKVGIFQGNDEQDFSFASYLVRLRFKTSSFPAFFSYLLNTEAVLGFVRANAFVAIGQCNLNPTRYGQIVLSIPPLIEQHEIVRYLNTETENFDTLSAEAQRAIDLLQERRSALISAAVTGQIDVRQEIEEPVS